MNYQEEIEYRNAIISRASIGIRPTAEERLWLATHRCYNSLRGYPYLNYDIIQIQKKAKYCLRIRIESKKYSGSIFPIVDVPGSKGQIKTHSRVVDFKGNVTYNKPVKMLCLLLNSEHEETQIEYSSELGLLGIAFECEYVDEKQHIIIRQSSSTGDPRFAMLCERVSENKVIYRCKTPVNENFDSFVFSVEWDNRTGDGVVS